MFWHAAQRFRFFRFLKVTQFLVLCLKGPHTPCLSLTYTKIEQFIKADDESRGNFIPLELWKLMDELHRRGMGSTTMFRAQGVESERNAIISALDGGIDGAVQVSSDC